MKKLREAYENDMVAVNVSPALCPAWSPCCRGQGEIQSAPQCVTTSLGPHPAHPHRVESSTFYTFLCVFPLLATGQPDPRTEPQCFGHLLHRAVHAPIHTRGPRGCSCHPLPPLCSKCGMCPVSGGSCQSCWVWVDTVAVGTTSWAALTLGHLGRVLIAAVKWRGQGMKVATSWESAVTPWDQLQPPGISCIPILC